MTDRKPYEKPNLNIHGKLKDITHKDTGGKEDNSYLPSGPV